MRIALAAFAVLSIAACSSPAPLYQIEPTATETTIDGVASEWPAALRPVPSESGLSIGLRRDADDLVVVLLAGDDRQARRIALGGVAVWIDPAGGTDRALGVRYPTPADPEVEQVLRNAPRRGGPSSADPQRLRRRYEAGLQEVEVTTGVVTQRATPIGGYDGLEVASTWGTRGLVVEMRIPIAGDDALLDVPPGGELGIGVELLDASRTALRRSVSEARRNARTDDRSAERAETAAIDLDSITRWLRVELG